eukprot:UN05187
MDRLDELEQIAKDSGSEKLSIHSHTHEASEELNGPRDFDSVSADEYQSDEGNVERAQPIPSSPFIDTPDDYDSKLPPILHWTMLDVLQWLQKLRNGYFEPYLPDFEKYHIDGEMLTKKTDEFFERTLGMRPQAVKNIACGN